MNEINNLAYILSVLFIVVFVLNVLPAFAPPTWVTMSFIGLAIPSIDVLLLAAVAAVGATCGRIVLAKLSRQIVRQKLLTEQSQRKVDAIKTAIENKASSNDWYIPRLFAQPVAIQLSVYCLRIDLTTDCV